MIKHKKILGGLTFLLAGVLLPGIVNAKAYYQLSDMTINESPVYGGSFSSDYYTFYAGRTGIFNFKLTTVELDNSKTYTVSFKSDFLNYSKDYTGEELNNGVNLVINDAKSFVEIKINEKDTSNEIFYKYEIVCSSPDDQYCTPGTYYIPAEIMFSDEIDSSEIDAYYNSITKDCKIDLNSIRINEPESESSITAALSIYNTKKFSIYGYNYDGKDYINITDRTNRRHSKEYEVTYTYKETDTEIKKKVDEYVNNMNVDNLEEVLDKIYIMTDLENINYRYSTLNADIDELDRINSILNYSSGLQEKLEHANIEGILDVRAGWGTALDEGAFGFIDLLYGGTVYGVANGVGVWQINVIYVPDDTANTREAFIKAAEERIKNYLKDTEVKITYAGEINTYISENNLNKDKYFLKMLNTVGQANTLGEYYKVSLNGHEFNYFIAKGSNKMNAPYVSTKDLKTNIVVTTEGYEAPLDSKINTELLSKDSEEYKSLMSKLKISDGVSADIKLYSKSQDAYVSKLNNGKFKVYIPVDESYKDKTLVAYFVNDDGTVEEHEAVYEDGYAVFETDHFSTYTIAEKASDNNTTKEESKTKNPKTGDNILVYMSTSLLSLILLIGSIILVKKS